MPNNLIVSECPSQDPAVQMLWETVYGPSAGRSPVPPGPNSSVASNPPTGTVYDMGGAVYNLKSPTYGIKGDAKTVTDGAITNGLAVLTSATAAFTVADIGKYVTVAGAGTAPQPLSATILSLNSATSVNLSANAQATVSGATVNIGTGNAVALQALVNLVSAAGGGTIYVPPDATAVGYGLENPIAWKSYVNLVGSGWSSTFFELNPNANILQVQDSEGVLIEGMRFFGTGGPGIPGRAAIWATLGSVYGARRSRFINNYFDTVGSCGISTDTSTELVIAGNMVLASKEHGIYISDNTNDSVVANNVILNAGLNNGTSNPIQGINMENCHRVTVTGNVIETPKNNGILHGSRTAGPTHNTITANTIRECPDWAIRIGYGSQLVISANILLSAAGVGTQAAIGTYLSGGGNTVSGVTITGNVCDYYQAGFFTYNTGTVSGFFITGNYIVGNQSGASIYQISVKSTNDVVSDNYLLGGVGRGIEVQAASTGCRLLNNHIFLAGTKYTDSGTNTILLDPANPGGVSAITVTASPFTYTAGATPEAVYISGGTITTTVKNGVTIFGAVTNVSVYLDPREAIVVTYTGAPAMNRDKK